MLSAIKDNQKHIPNAKINFVEKEHKARWALETSMAQYLRAAIWDLQKVTKLFQKM